MNINFDVGVGWRTKTLMRTRPSSCWEGRPAEGGTLGLNLTIGTRPSLKHEATMARGCAATATTLPPL
ncbi:hypothetical protein HaLaN_23008 [Haematococcus lacustris]|uniref:Uncharacterized protein n=1 Tax=Haematococcus lacustris TaxID=44745 RepID=A0A699ZV56_HAELA|nr:hypothetical protein HaLaN_23008 [Haematococcus lacustris]